MVLKNLRESDDDEIQPIPSIPEVGKWLKNESPSHDLGGRLERVDGGENHPKIVREKIFL